MVSRYTFMRFLVAACAVGVAAAAGVFGWLAYRGKPGERDTRSLPFRECATEAGITWRMHFLNTEQGETFKINLYDHGAGLAVGDFDGDGRDDLYFCNQLGPNALYRNRGDGTFEEVAQKAGVALGDRVCCGATFVDYDNSGHPSLFVTSTRGGNVLFHNQGDGTFRDVTREAGLSHVGHSQTAVFFDYDNDGFLDLFLTNTAEWTSDTYDPASPHYVGKEQFGGVMLSRKEPNVLYHNEPVDPADPSRGRRFVDVTDRAGLRGRGWAADAAAFDYDGDGRPDLFVTSMFGRCQLYHNDGNGTFTDVTLDALGRTPWGAIGCKVFDLNNDGRLDLLVTDMHSDMWMGVDYSHASRHTALAYEKQKFPYLNGPRALDDPGLIRQEKEWGKQVGFRHEELLFGNACYRNEGGGKFAEVSDRAGLETFWPWGIAVGDFDNDGWEDVFLPSGMGYPFFYWPNYLLMNQGDGTFRNRAAELGIEPPPRGQFLPDPIAGRPAARSGRCAATGDFDGDGRLEIVTNNFNDQPYYFKNQLPRRNYVAFRLRGTRSNRDAVGAVVRLYQGGRVLTRQVQAAGGYLAQSSYTLHFGLGDRPAVDRVEIRWPSGIRQTIRGPALNRRNDVIEPDRDDPGASQGKS
jgi:hypothetical protein